jgi:hypothetical protein
VIEAAAPPQGAAATITARGPSAKTCAVRSNLTTTAIHIQAKDLTSQSLPFTVVNELQLHLRNDSLSFHPVHPLIRAFGPRVLHHAKGRGPAVFRRTPIIPPSPAFRPPKRGREAAGTREIAWGDKQSHVSRIHSGFDGRTRL